MDQYAEYTERTRHHPTIPGAMATDRTFPNGQVISVCHSMHTNPGPHFDHYLEQEKRMTDHHDNPDQLIKGGHIYYQGADGTLHPIGALDRDWIKNTQDTAEYCVGGKARDEPVAHHETSLPNEIMDSLQQQTEHLIGAGHVPTGNVDVKLAEVDTTTNTARITVTMDLAKVYTEYTPGDFQVGDSVTFCAEGNIVATNTTGDMQTEHTYYGSSATPLTVYVSPRGSLAVSNHYGHRIGFYAAGTWHTLTVY